MFCVLQDKFILYKRKEDNLHFIAETITNGKGQEEYNMMTTETAISTRDVRIGSKFTYNPIGNIYKIPKEELGTEEDQIFTTEDLGWRLDVIGKQFCLVSESVTSQKLNLKYVKDKELAIRLLNSVAVECYSNPKVADKVCCMNEAIYNKIADVNKPVKGNAAYWLASSYIKEIDGLYEPYIRWVNTKQCIYNSKMSMSDNVISYESKLPIRIVVFLKPGVRFYKIRTSDGDEKIAIKK